MKNHLFIIFAEPPLKLALAVPSQVENPCPCAARLLIISIRYSRTNRPGLVFKIERDSLVHFTHLAFLQYVIQVIGTVRLQNLWGATLQRRSLLVIGGGTQTHY